jgi:hypothetical protein
MTSPKASSLGDYVEVEEPIPPSTPSMPPVGGGGGGSNGSAMDGVSMVDAGSNTVKSAINTASNALGGGGGGNPQAYKKGGKVVTTRMKPPIKRNDKCSNW